MPTIREQLILHESLRLYPYLDTVGKITVGVGRNLSDRGISRELALQWLDEDIRECEIDMAKFAWYPLLDPIRQRVLLDMRFNLGPKRFRQFKGTLQAVEEGDYTTAADRMLDSKWAKQTKTRATRLAQMMRSGMDYDD